jgi:hypothetical protein
MEQADSESCVRVAIQIPGITPRLPGAEGLKIVRDWLLVFAPIALLVRAHQAIVSQ